MCSTTSESVSKVVTIVLHDFKAVWEGIADLSHQEEGGGLDLVPVKEALDQDHT